MFLDLVRLGKHPKEMSDTVTVMERIGHFLDDSVSKIYKKLKKEGVSKMDASSIIAERIDLQKILTKASMDWDGGYVIGGLIGHGDALLLGIQLESDPRFFTKMMKLLS